jgi:6-phosphogluconolactonase
VIRVYSDHEAMSVAAARLFVDGAQRAVARQGRFAVLLAGGETPRRCYELLAGEPFRSRVPWRAVHVFWGDERCVPADDARSNAGMARRAMLDQVPVPETQVHAIGCDRSPATGAAAYEELLRSFFTNGPSRFDFVFLGLGGNGHTVSLFPGSLALAEAERWVVETVPGAGDVPRVTVTAPLINQAALIVFLVSGESKSAVVREMLEGTPDPDRRPAALIRPVAGEVVWLVDRAAAMRLRQETRQAGR